MVKAALHNSPLLLLSLLCSFLLNKTFLAGNNYIAATADQLLTGQTISLSPILAPLLKMIGFGTLCAYAKAISGKYYSSMVQRDVRLSLGNHLLQLPYSYFDEKGTGSILTRLISDIGEMGRFFAETLPNLLANTITVATATIYLIQMDTLLIAVLFAGYPIMLAAADRLSKKLAEITRGRITIGDMLAFILILNRILYPISDIVFCASDIREASVSLKRIQEIQRQPGERTSGHITKIPENQKEIPAIQWNNVDFSYTPGQGRPVINHMTFTIGAGQQIAFVGGSGEGKTTIFKLLCGLYQQTGGQYALFGHDAVIQFRKINFHK